MSKNPAAAIAAAPQSTIRFIKEAREELRKVSWPSRETTVRYTLIVIVSSIAIGLVIGAMDYVFSLVLQRFI